MALESITIWRPADMHAHFREYRGNPWLEVLAKATARHFDIAVAMPNLVPPITEPNEARKYCQALRDSVVDINPYFRPLGVAYLTDNLSPITIKDGFTLIENETDRRWHAGKFYPANATTNSSAGVTDITNLFPTLAVMENIGMPLLIHGELLEHNGIELAPWERERAFLEHMLPIIRKRFPGLLIVLEHISTADAVDVVLADKTGGLAATITPHHLTASSVDLVKGGFRTHGYCMPILKTPRDRLALRRLATLGHPCVFAGTDSAPHLVSNKQSACCPGGAFVAPDALEAYAAVFEEERVFDEEDGVERFQAFMSTTGPNFYGIPHSSRTITLIRNPHGKKTPQRFCVPVNTMGGDVENIVPFYSAITGFEIRFPWVVAD